MHAIHWSPFEKHFNKRGQGPMHSSSLQQWHCKILTQRNNVIVEGSRNQLRVHTYHSSSPRAVRSSSEISVPFFQDENCQHGSRGEEPGNYFHEPLQVQCQGGGEIPELLQEIWQHLLIRRHLGCLTLKLPLFSRIYIIFNKVFSDLISFLPVIYLHTQFWHLKKAWINMHFPLNLRYSCAEHILDIMSPSWSYTDIIMWLTIKWHWQHFRSTVIAF